MRLLKSLAVLFLGLLWCVTAKSAQGDRVLVVLEDAGEKASYSQFWADLEERDFKLTFESPKSEKLTLFKHGELNYDHLILAPPKSKGYGPNLTPKHILDFTNAGGNVLLGLSSSSPVPSAIASLLLEFDISLPPDRSSVVVDHFSHEGSSAQDKHDILVVPQPGAVRPDLVNYFGGDGILAVPHAVGQTLGNNNPLLVTILRALPTAYVYNSNDEDADGDVFATGTQISLVSAIQARNSARFTVLGSIEMLSNKWFGANYKTKDGKNVKTANKIFARQLTEWTFKEVGVLRAGQIEHHEVTDASKPLDATTQVGFLNPTIYRIKNDVSFSIELSQWDRTGYKPYTPPPADAIQLEFTMLSPFHRLPLVATSTTANATIYSTAFKLPDQHGIFAFRVNYKRPFLTNIDEKRQVTVRHFAHDEWPRSWRISGAWPWISGLWTVIGGFLSFVVLWLYCEPPKKVLNRSS